jgi:hypothetical protein
MTKEIRTERRIPIPEKTAFEGGNSWGKESLSTQNDEERCETRETGAGAKNLVGREGMQHIDDRSEPLEQFGIAPLEFVKRPGLLLEYIKDRVGTVAAIDTAGEWVIAEIIPRLLGVVRQRGIEKGLKVGGSGGCIRSRGHWDNGGDVGRFDWKGRG